MRDDVRTVTAVYEESLRKHGAVPQGVYWPSASDLAKRFRLQLVEAGIETASPERRLRVLDLGCGPGLLLDYLEANGWLDRVDYTGVDVVASTIEIARQRWPDRRFDVRDLRDQPYPPEAFDACVMCGVFTGRPGIGYDEMVNLVRSTLSAVWPSVSHCLVFNTMAKHVDWERDDLFHWPLDEAMAVCKADLSRHVRIRLDYGLWETTFVVLRQADIAVGTVPSNWT